MQKALAIHLSLGLVAECHKAFQILPPSHTSDWQHRLVDVHAASSFSQLLNHQGDHQAHSSSSGNVTVNPRIVTDPDFNLNKTIPTIRHHKTPQVQGGHGHGDKHGAKDDHGAEDEHHGAAEHDDHGAKSDDAHGGHGGGHGGHGGMTHHQHKVWLAKSVVAPLTAVFMLVFSIISVMEYTHLSWLPEAAIIIGVGACLGFALVEVMPKSIQETVFGSLNSTLLNLLLLPPLIFETGWTVRRRDFASQFGYIMIFAVIGVVISTVVVGLLVTFTGSIGLHPAITMRTAFAYAALISATDPVATLATYTELKVDPILYTMVFGESCLNDGVAIVLFNVFNNDAIMATVGNPGMFTANITWEVVNIFSGSVIIGVVLAVVYVLGLRFTGMRRSPKLEILYIATSPYLTFAITEALAYSGIISVLFCAFVMGMYARPHLSTEGALLATFFIKQTATINDIAVFLFVGVSVVQVTTKGLEIAGSIMVAAIVGRFCAVYPLGWIVNILKIGHGRSKRQPREDWHLLTNRHLFMMAHAGLRGAIALVMAMEFGDWVEKDNGPGTRQMLLNVTFLIICVFLFLFGGTTEMCLSKLKISMGKPTPPDYLYKSEVDGWFRSWSVKVHDNYLVPILIGEERLAAHIEESEQEVDVESALACGRGVTGVPFTPRGVSSGDGSQPNSPRKAVPAF